MNVYVVTSTELGWDCVVAVFDADEVSEEDIRESFPARGYVITNKTVELNTKDWSDN